MLWPALATGRSCFLFTVPAVLMPVPARPDKPQYMKISTLLHSAVVLLVACISVPSAVVAATSEPLNPILPGFNPDPSICRVGDEYYICTSSFTWYPGLPIYRSRDLVNWELASHVIDRPGMVTLEGVNDKDGIWAPTIRHHDGKWYVFCNVSNGGNFFVTADSVTGPWSDPVFIKNMPGIDPSPFWDTDGRCYVLGNVYQFPGRKYRGSTAIFIQELDLGSGRLVGERTILTSGHAFNARYAEGAHLYRIGRKYVMTVSEGGTNEMHAVTVFTSDSLRGPYLPQQINPALSQRQFGYGSPLQAVGHADLVQTPRGHWYAVALGKRMVEGKYAFTRETFLCPVEIQHGEFVFNPGRGGMTIDIPRPDLPVSKVVLPPDSDSFDGPRLLSYWHFNRIPHATFHSFDGGWLRLSLQKEVIDSLTCPAMLLRRTRSLSYEATTLMDFSPRRAAHKAGLVLHRNSTAYVALLRTRDGLQVVESGRVSATIPYRGDRVWLRLRADGINATLEYGSDPAHMHKAAGVSLVQLADDGRLNRFNGLGVGVYATSGVTKSKDAARFDFFSYKDN